MKKIATLTVALLAGQQASAGEVKVNPDGTTGKGFGGLSGMMIGAAGGPVGIMVGAMAGAYTGSNFEKEQASILDVKGNEYLLKTESGEEVWVQTEQATSFHIGDVVQIVGDQIVGIGDHISGIAQTGVDIVNSTSAVASEVVDEISPDSSSNQ